MLNRSCCYLSLASLFCVSACVSETSNEFGFHTNTPTASDTDADLSEPTDAADSTTDPSNETWDSSLDRPSDVVDLLHDVAEVEDALDEPDAELPSFGFAVFGDNQFSVNSCESGVPVRMAIPEVVLDLGADFLLHTGDLMDHGWEDDAYVKFVECYSEMLATIPFFPTGGNHDYGCRDGVCGITRYKAFVEEQLFERNPDVYGDDYEEDFEIWYEDDTTDWSTDRSDPSDRELLPSGVSWKTYYAFRHQNAFFISFEQGTRWWTQTPKPWLEDHLIAASSDPTIDHIFVTMHHPMYSATMDETSDSECIEPVRRHYEDLFRQYDVTMVFSGHAHCYDRFYVPDDGHETRETEPPEQYLHDGEAVHYIVTGGGGGGLTNGCDPLPLKEEHSYQYSQARGCYRHVTHIEVDGETLTVTIWQVEGGATSYESTIEDRFVITPL